MTRFASVVLAALALAACTSPDDALRSSLGPDYGPPGATHRPGQPCVLCHNPSYPAGDTVIEVGGTVYMHPTDTVGLANAWVHVVDAEGSESIALTNETGNFMIEVGAVDAMTVYPGGVTLVPHAPVYPLTVSQIANNDGSVTNQMQTNIRREGSCAGCHAGDPNAVSPGRVALVVP